MVYSRNKTVFVYFWYTIQCRMRALSLEHSDHPDQAHALGYVCKFVDMQYSSHAQNKTCFLCNTLIIILYWLKVQYHNNQQGVESER